METDDNITLDPIENDRLGIFSATFGVDIYVEVLRCNDGDLSVYAKEAVRMANMAGNSGYTVWEVAEMEGWDLTCPVSRGVLIGANFLQGKD